MIITSAKGISTKFRLFTCNLALGIITMPGLLLTAKTNNDISFANYQFSSPGSGMHLSIEVPYTMFSINEAPSQFAKAAIDAEIRIREFFGATDYQNELFSHFRGKLNQPNVAWMKKAAQLKNLVMDKKFNLTIQMTPSSEMDFMMSAFIVRGSNGKPMAMINRNWIEYGITHEAFTRLIIEQSGFAFDRFLNGHNDTKGNEGKSFANELGCIYEEPLASKTPTYVHLGGRKVLVEY